MDCRRLQVSIVASIEVAEGALSASCHTLMVALLGSTIGGGCRICCGAGAAAEAGLLAPFVGDKEV